MIVLLEQEAGLRLRRVRVRDRLWARLRAAELDRGLAGGASPESNVSLSLHAARVYRPSQCRTLARSLRRLADTTADTSRLHRVPLNRNAIGGAQEELDAVVDRLTAARPADARGVARIRLLLSDGAGPLYGGARPERLRRELRSALEAMERTA
jgi:hypothetical protein